MLTGITLKNYTTFIKTTEFDFRAKNYKILEDTNVGDNRILKGALFVGGNASGKTQVLDAIFMLLRIMLDNAEQVFSIKKSLYTPGDKFSIEYTFNIDNNDIKYEVVFKGNEIYSEKLSLNGKLKLERLKNTGERHFLDDIDTQEISEINPSLSVVKLEYYNTRFNNDVILNKWFDFLKNSIYLNCLTGTTIIYNLQDHAETNIKKYSEQNTADDINKFIDKLGYDSNVIFKKKDKENDSVAKSGFSNIYFKKKGTEVEIPYRLESAGNKAFINCILPIKYATTHNCMLIFDEFSSGLHNELAEALIRFFYNNSNNSQLFFVSHSTNLLDTSIIRPDQIYSLRFDPKDGTKVKRFSDENPRESQNIEKMYLNGVFNGMPNYNKEFKI